MTQWRFWGDKQFLDVYENIYLRTFVEDWFKIISFIAKEIRGKNILDIGCGEGHTTKQVLDRLKESYVCDLVEPDKNALSSAKMFLNFENNIGNCYVDTLSSFKPAKKYDTIFTSHTNYYWSSNEEDYKKQLEKLISMLNKNWKLLILTLPEDSDHYNIMLRQVYPKFNYSKYMISYYKKKGLKVKSKIFRMRMYVGDMLTNNNLFDVKNFYRFIHNINTYPSNEDAKKFLSKIKKYQKNGYLDFKDELIVVTK